MKFVYPGDSHRHSLQVLNALYEYDDFMESIATVADLGCGSGEDLEWWATRTTREDNPQPLNIQCQGIDLLEQLPMAKKHDNITYQRTDFEGKIHAPQKGFDILWCHDAFQYCVNPVQTLSNWWHIASAQWLRELRHSGESRVSCSESESRAQPTFATPPSVTAMATDPGPRLLLLAIALVTIR